ncbi:hypothetical protein HDU93_004006 [Gonapodya sp. JEL0774]|nr:hypothetical protein HDU93_004006 [Gonapodya sp. JEL0774]
MSSRPDAPTGHVIYLPNTVDADTPEGTAILARLVAPSPQSTLFISRRKYTLEQASWALAFSGIPHTCGSFASAASSVAARLQVATLSNDHLIDFFDTQANNDTLAAWHDFDAALATLSEAQPDNVSRLLTKILTEVKKHHHPSPNGSHVAARLRELFPIAPGAPEIPHLSTIHAVKGDEAARVVILNVFDFDLLRGPSCSEQAGGLCQRWQRVQEFNVLYVALTRSKNQLIFVDVTAGSPEQRKIISRKIKNISHVFRSLTV